MIQPFIVNGMRSLSIDPKGRILSGVKPNEAKEKRNAKTISPRQFHTSKRQRVALVGKLASRQARALKGLAA